MFFELSFLVTKEKAIGESKYGGTTRWNNEIVDKHSDNLICFRNTKAQWFH